MNPIEFTDKEERALWDRYTHALLHRGHDPSSAAARADEMIRMRRARTPDSSPGSPA